MLLLLLLPSSASSHVARCGTDETPVICDIHHYVDRTWEAQDALGLPRTPYSYDAERTEDTDYREWLRHEWRMRAADAEDALDALTPYSQAWLEGALCVHQGEGAWDSNTGNGYYGGMQFDVGTWLSNGGGQFAPRADLATPQQQLLVTYWTWERRGWTPWPTTAAACGLL